MCTVHFIRNSKNTYNNLFYYLVYEICLNPTIYYQVSYFQGQRDYLSRNCTERVFSLHCMYQYIVALANTTIYIILQSSNDEVSGSEVCASSTTSIQSDSDRRRVLTERLSDWKTQQVVIRFKSRMCFSFIITIEKRRKRVKEDVGVQTYAKNHSDIYFFFSPWAQLVAVVLSCGASDGILILRCFSEAKTFFWHCF